MRSGTLSEIRTCLHFEPQPADTYRQPHRRMRHLQMMLTSCRAQHTLNQQTGSELSKIQPAIVIFCVFNGGFS